LITDIADEIYGLFSLFQRWFWGVDKRLLAHPTWQQIQLSTKEWQSFKRQIKVMSKIWQRRRQQRMKALAQ
jgi:hypothetical protein